MIICEECGNKYKLKLFKLFKREVECPYCDATIDFSSIKRVNRVRLLLKTIYMVAYFVILAVVMLLYTVLLYRWFPLPQRLLIGLLLWGIIVVIDAFVLRSIARRVIAKAYNNRDREASCGR